MRTIAATRAALTLLGLATLAAAGVALNVQPMAHGHARMAAGDEAAGRPATENAA